MKRYFRELREVAAVAAYVIGLFTLGGVCICATYAFAISLFTRPAYGTWWEFLLIAILSGWATFTFNFLVTGRGRT